MIQTANQQDVEIVKRMQNMLTATRDHLRTQQQHIQGTGLSLDIDAIYDELEEASEILTRARDRADEEAAHKV